MRSLQNKVAIVIGATGGLGTILTEELASQGVKLVLASTNPKKLNQMKEKYESEGVSIIVSTIDVTNEEEVKTLFHLVQQTYGQADILVNLAGLSIPAKVEAMAEEQYDSTMDVNVKGTYLCCKHFIPISNKEDGAHIINIGSMAAKRANPNAPMYCTAKAAVNMFSQGLAMQVMDQNIRVTTLNPGGVDTAFWGDRQVAREKFLKASDVVDVMLFILTRDTRVVFHDIAFESFFA
ncbi:NADP-dependent 3-hydroxy acid dehydrogenase YdfG [Paenibacillus rhizosphaerae]|uniref:NADP-dependent 3-hydroxy acid dehydrogenase YdfG n=1 Tax=Paenibacillus rhizosphaerae TaxID=297318 RepID=A0A839TI30_9BACL|nr:SDR family oxidoreductase [Paenibacillus rhizosphaerae]MBB3125410.1 NADP-dependent 3-hydroxy acid dehydrogenase YdfG [Paenibacillus rhizosphaerae]